MSNFKRTRIEVSGQGDVELLDFALDEFGFGEVQRSSRWLNIKRWEHIQFSFTRGGKTRVWQPFRAEYARNAAGNLTITCRNSTYLTKAVIEQAGFQVVSVEAGDMFDNGRPPSGMTMNLSCSLNGRSLKLNIGGKS